MSELKNKIIAEVKKIYDPEIPVNIYELGLIYNITVDENNNVKKILIYPKKSKAMNLAFDVTPAKYVTGLITEKGVCEASSEGLKGLFK